MLPLWFAFIFAFFAMIVWLVIRKGRIIRNNLHDEMLVGRLSPAELNLVCSPIGRLQATLRYGALGRRFVACGARLGLCKWHAARAMKGKKKTISTDFIVPLRQELQGLGYELRRKMGIYAHPAAPGVAYPPMRPQDPRGYAQDPRRPPPGGHRR
jgi:hypothetical protein